jgi:CRP-like cAMP-binding protein
MATPQAQALRSIPLFAGLRAADREVLAGNLDEVSLPAGTELIREGDRNHDFYVLIDGQVDVAVGGQHRRAMGRGDFFGEISMGHRVPATATVTARTPVRAYVMSHAQYGALGRSPEVVARLQAAMSERLLADRQAAQGGPAD